MALRLKIRGDIQYVRKNIADDDVGAFRRETLGESLAEALSGAGDDGGLAGKIGHDSSP